MSEQATQLQSDSRAFDGRLILIIVVCTLVAEFLRGVKWLPFPIGLSLVYYFALLIGYWIGRRPTLTFTQFALRLTGYLIVVVTGLWAIPTILTRWVWKPIAFGVPVLLIGVWAYWMPPLYPTERKRGRFSLWLLCCIAFAVFYGWVVNSGD